MGAHGALEVAKTVLEVADVAWTAVERCHHHHPNHSFEDSTHESTDEAKSTSPSEDDLELLLSENRRLRDVLENNLKLLHQLSDSPSLLSDCPPDLYARLVSTVNSENYLASLKSLQLEIAKGTGTQFPFREATEIDYRSADILINVDQNEPSWWVWLSDEMVPSDVEEGSGIDDENYAVITEEHVLDGVAHFMAKCIMSNPKAKNLSPEELQKTICKAFEGVSKVEKIFHIWQAGKMFYTLSSWGLALAGLYNSRGVLRLAAKGVHLTSNAALKIL